MFCPKCGAQLPDVAKFCNKCGTDLRMLSEVQPRRESSYQYADHGYSKSAAVKKPRVARKKKKKSNLMAGILAVVLVVGIFVAVLVPSTINYNKKSKLKTANSNARTAAISASEMFYDAMTNGLSVYDVLYGYSDGDEISESGSIIKYAVEAGKTYDASDPDSITDGGAKVIATALSENVNAGYFVVIDTYENDEEMIVVQWKAEKDSEEIGQAVINYSPDNEYGNSFSVDNLSGYVDWDSYKEKHPRWGKYYKN